MLEIEMLSFASMAWTTWQHEYKIEYVRQDNTDITNKIKP